MYKLFSTLAMVLLTITFTGCSPQSTASTPSTQSNPSNATPNTANQTPGTPASTPGTVTFTKELSYLPSYNGLQTSEFTPASGDKLAKIKYVLNGTTDVQVYESYREILKKDGWMISQEQPVIGFAAKKDPHQANITISSMEKAGGKEVYLTIQSK